MSKQPFPLPSRTDDASLDVVSRLATPVSTQMAQHAYVAPGGFQAPQLPVYRASTVFFENTAAMHSRDWRSRERYSYGLHGTPTSFALEARIATLEGGRHTLLTPSGLSAVSLVNFALLGAGDEVLLPDNVYGPNKDLAQQELSRFGITHRFFDPSLGEEGLKAAIGPKTRLVWLEAPGSVTLEFPDLLGQVKACKAQGVTVVLDNTWGAGLAFRPFDLLGDGSLGVDVSVQALTKYPSGGGDVLMGSVTTVDERLHAKLMATHSRQGIGVGAHDIDAVLRALPTIEMRYAFQDASARRLGDWLAQQPEVAEVLHPARPGSPGHAHWAALCTQAAGLVSVRLREGLGMAQANRLVDALSRFRIGFSWGGPVSLAVPYDLSRMRQAGLSGLASGALIRFSTGLECVEDLLADLAQAFETLRKE